MITVRNEKLIKRNSQIGKYSGIISIVILAGGMYASFKLPDQVIYSLAALLLGFTLSQIGIFYTTRFGRSPRPDQELDDALKGLDDQYALYHYTSAVAHLLVGPAGIWILFPYLQKGKIIYDEKRKRWKRKGGSVYLRFFAQDNIGNPAQDIITAIKRLSKDLGKIPDFKVPDIKAALIFTDAAAEVEAENAPIPTLHAGQLKKLIRKEAKGDTSLGSHVLKTVQDHLSL
jgi:hypothetical protein